MSMTWTEEPWPRTSLRVFSEILYKLHLTGRSSRTGYARETFQRHTAVHFVHPVSQKSRDGSPTAIVGLRLTSTDRAVYRHRFIDRKSTSFPLNCRVFSFRSRWIFTRSPPSNLLEEIGEPISAMMLLNRITDAARCSCRSRGLHRKWLYVFPLVSLSTERNRLHIALPTRAIEMPTNREIHIWLKEPCSTGSQFSFLCRTCAQEEIIFNMTSSISPC